MVELGAWTVFIQTSLDVLTCQLLAQRSPIRLTSLELMGGDCGPYILTVCLPLSSRSF